MADMVDKANPGVTGTPDTDSTPTPPAAARRGGPFRGNDVRDSVAELAARAQLISQEAGTKVAAAMKDVVSAAAGIAGFAIESARDLVQYMVRRGQMTPEEGDKLLREAEQAHAKRPAAERERATATRIAADRAAAAKAARLAAAETEHTPPASSRAKPEPKGETKLDTRPETRPEARPDAKKAPASKAASKSVKKSAAKKETTSAAKSPSAGAKSAKTASKSAKKPAAKKKH